MLIYSIKYCLLYVHLLFLIKQVLLLKNKLFELLCEKIH